MFPVRTSAFPLRCVVSMVRLARRFGVVVCSVRFRCFAAFIGASNGGLDIEDALVGLALARRLLDGVRQGALQRCQ